jgi:phosphonoacetaldehyde hydrolase
VFPPSAVVNIGDTIPDVDSGRNAGTWSVGVVQTGNMLGLSQAELRDLTPAERERRSETGRKEMLEAGAHFAIDSIEQLPELIVTINQKMAQGEMP